MASRGQTVRIPSMLLTFALTLACWGGSGCARSAPDAAFDAADLAAPEDAMTTQDAAKPAGDGAQLPDKLWGVTTDSIDKLPLIVASLAHLGLKHKPITRIVFDENQPPSEYAQAVPAIHAVSWVMGELLDSMYVKDISVAGYIARTKAYLSAFPDTVDLWEIGNEINGEWLIAKGGSADDVVAKMTGAYDAVKAAGKRTALTLYYNQDCWSSPQHELFAWTNAHVPERMRQGLDYVLVSYYEDDCNGLQPDWNAVFAELRKIFPNARLGFGECGTAHVASKAAYIKRYYGMKVEVPGFVGGYFWWYFRQDMVPDTSALFTALFDAIP